MIVGGEHRNNSRSGRLALGTNSYTLKTLFRRVYLARRQHWADMTSPTGRNHAALIGLPEPYFWLVPELDQVPWPDETLADCSNCVICPTPEQDPREERFFRPDVRCCGYHPWMPNHHVGRILREGGEGAQLMHRRMATSVGLKPEAVHRRTDSGNLHEWGQELHFGQSVSYRCPYWVGGTDACGIWQHRESVCRTWYCRHVEGVYGGGLWYALRMASAWCDERLARYCSDQGSPPSPDAELSGWVEWYTKCAETLDGAPREQIQALSNDELKEARRHLRERNAERTAPRPEVVEPAVQKVEDLKGGVRLFGGAAWNYVEVPRVIFSFLALLDGEITWRAALERLEPQTREIVDEALVERLVLGGILRPVES